MLPGTVFFFGFRKHIHLRFWKAHDFVFVTILSHWGPHRMFTACEPLLLIINFLQGRQFQQPFHWVAHTSRSKSGIYAETLTHIIGLFSNDYSKEEQIKTLWRSYSTSGSMQTSYKFGENIPMKYLKSKISQFIKFEYFKLMKGSMTGQM